MKQALTLLASCLVLGTAQGQTQLTSSEMMPVGTSFKMKTVTNESIIDTTIQGANVTWNLTGLVTDNSADEFNVQVVTPASTPFGGSFSNANYAFKESPDIAYRYFNLTSTKMERVGSYTTSANVYSNPQVEYVFPLAMGVSNHDTWANTNSSFGGTYDLKCLGYGTLKLPGVTYDSALMVEVTLDETILGFTSYFWYSSKNGMPLLQYVIGDGFFIPTFAQYTYTSSITTGVKEAGKLHIEGLSYNNPVQEVLTLNFAEDTQPLVYTIVNQLGQVVTSGSIKEIQKNQQENIDMQQAEAGMYFLNLSNSSTGETQTVKLLKK
ncbi:MAG: T9SS type A sorting domain-containing protein [Bacteroidota bacterium]